MIQRTSFYYYYYSKYSRSMHTLASTLAKLEEFRKHCRNCRAAERFRVYESSPWCTTYSTLVVPKENDELL